MARVRITFCALLAVALFATAGFAAGLTDSLKAGKPDIKAAGALTFGPEGILFVGDSVGGALFALDTADNTASKATPVEVKGVNTKVAAMLGTAADQILINDMAVHPISHKTYLSVSRGRGPEATPVILRIDTTGKIEEVSLANVKFAKAALPNPPDASNARNRTNTITDLAFVDGKVLVAGLSNEEFSSNLKSIPFPFQTSVKGVNVEIYHASHGRFETASPIRKFVPYKIRGEQNILASYTCTPLVKIPVASLQGGAQVKGTTIAELGSGNTPLDMIVYTKGGVDYILMNNNNRGVMKISTARIDTYPAITAPSDIKGLPYETVKELTGVTQLAKVDDANGVVLTNSGGSLDLKPIVLP
jgi:hypothetical protein